MDYLGLSGSNVNNTYDWQKSYRVNQISGISVDENVLSSNSQTGQQTGYKTNIQLNPSRKEEEIKPQPNSTYNTIDIYV